MEIRGESQTMPLPTLPAAQHQVSLTSSREKENINGTLIFCMNVIIESVSNLHCEHFDFARLLLFGLCDFSW